MYSLTEATIEFQSHFDTVWAKYGGRDHHVDSFIAHKLRHVYGVLDATLRVIAMEPALAAMDASYKRDAEIVAMWHDIGRFYQVRDDRIVGNKEYEHGDGAFALLQKKYPDRLPILLAVKIHNKFSHDQLLDEPAYQSLSPDDKNRAMFLTKVVRDADKIQNLTYFVFDNFSSLERFDKQIYGGGPAYTEPVVSDAVMHSLQRKEMVSHKDLVTFPDCLLSHYTWLVDINFASSHTIIRQLRLYEVMIDRLRTYGVSQETLAAIPRLG